MKPILRSMVALLTLDAAVAMTAITSSAEQEPGPVCAVLPLDAGSGVHAGQAGLLANQYSIALVRARRYQVLPRYEVNKTLHSRGFSRGRFATSLKSAVAAGKALNADYVIVGSVGKTDTGFALATSLISVDEARTATAASNQYDGAFDAFTANATPKNVKLLLGIDAFPDAAPAVAPVEREPVQAAAQPAHAPVTHARPTLVEKTTRPEVVPQPRVEPTPRHAVKQVQPVARPPQEAPAPPPDIIALQKAPPPPTISSLPPEIGVAAAPVIKPLPAIAPTESKTLLQEVAQAETGQDESRGNAAVAPGTAPVHDSGRSLFFDDLAAAAREKLDIGIRFNHYIYQTEEDDYIGSIDTIESDNQYIFDEPLLDGWWPNGLYLLWRFNPELAAELTYTELRAITLSHGGNHTDGTVVVGGPILSLLRRFPNDTTFTPYAGLGLAFFVSTRVTGDNPWHNGFGGRDWDGYNAWVASGSPEWPNGGYQRTFRVADELGYVAAVGLEKEIGDHWSLDLNARYTYVVFENTYTLSFYGNPRGNSRYSEWDLSNFNLGLGFKYSF